jgi:hypothetical protein
MVRLKIRNSGNKARTTSACRCGTYSSQRYWLSRARRIAESQMMPAVSPTRRATNSAPMMAARYSGTATLIVVRADKRTAGNAAALGRSMASGPFRFIRFTAAA